MIRLIFAAAVGAAAYYFYRQHKLLSAPGSTTNASDAVDDIPLGRNPTIDEKLDAGVQETFPASDPVSIAQPSETAYERQKRERESGKTL
jgi:hypothetical protein